MFLGSRETRQPRYKKFYIARLWCTQVIKNNKINCKLIFVSRSSYTPAVKTSGKCPEKPLNKTTGIQKFIYINFVIFGLRQSSYFGAAAKKTKRCQIPAIIRSLALVRYTLGSKISTMICFVDFMFNLALLSDTSYI